MSTDEQNKAAIESTIEQTLSAGLADADPTKVMEILGSELERQTGESSLLLSSSPEEWVLSPAGDEGVPRAQGLASRFLDNFSTALRRELCDSAGGCLNEKYRAMLSGQDMKANLSALAPAVLAAVGMSTALVAPGVIAALVSVWLLRVGLEQWCTNATSENAPSAQTGITPSPGQL